MPHAPCRLAEHLAHGIRERGLGDAVHRRGGHGGEHEARVEFGVKRVGGAEPIAAMDRLIAGHPQHISPGDVTSVAHGDFRIGNVIFHPTQPRVLAC
jgi:aminoglycoside phosphotransferase (APT) family kinase protein